MISAYIITFAALLLPAGSVADLHGRRRTVVAGLGLFTVASAACGLAHSEIALEASRAVQGIGAALLLSSALAIISSTFSGSERPKAYAFWGTCIGIAMALGPIAGGIITGLFGWRWAFLINLPLGVTFIAAMFAIVPESRDPGAQRFDWFGVLSLSGALFALTWALIDGNATGWSSPAILTRLAAFAALLGAFVAIETRQTRPMLELELFRRRDFLGTVFGSAGYGAGAQVMIFFLPLYLQSAFGFAPLQAGVAMLPFAVPLFIAPRVAASLLGRWPHRSALALGLGISVAGNLAMAAFAHLDNYAAFTLAMVVAGIATGVLNPQTVTAMQAQLPPARAGMASGIGGTIRFVSLLIGVAVLGSVMAGFRPVFHAGADADAGTAFSAVALTAALISAIALAATALLMRRSAPQLRVGLVDVGGVEEPRGRGHGRFDLAEVHESVDDRAERRVRGNAVG